jgi:hypothetical protein
VRRPLDRCSRFASIDSAARPRSCCPRCSEIRDTGWIWRGSAQRENCLPESAVAELRQNSTIDTEPLPYIQILNTTEWRITKTRWTVKNAAGAGVTGDTATRSVDHSVHIEPNSLAAFYLELGRFGHDASIALDKAWGVRRSE